MVISVSDLLFYAVIVQKYVSMSYVGNLAVHLKGSTMDSNQCFSNHNVYVDFF